MNQIPLFETTPHWTVTELTRYLRQVLEGDTTLQDVWVQGEISNFSRPSSGHLYFTLKDAGSSLRCVVWKTDASRLRMTLQDGMAVEAHGAISIYEVGGQYQLYVNLIKPVGEGVLYQEYLRLKAVLEAEGLFDPSRKRPIPDLPKRIGIITSPTGAALHDMLNILRRRLPLADVVFAPSPVQGEDAPSKLVNALKSLDKLALDVILLARGGGSIEDLWAFNDERVVRAVSISNTPVISGVGHETDFTLTDFAADLRAPTPTAAAELASTISTADLAGELSNSWARLVGSFEILVDRSKSKLETLDFRLKQTSPSRRLQTDRQRVDEMSRRLESSTHHRLELLSLKIQAQDQRLTALSPLEVLKRGFAVVNRSKDGKLIQSIKHIKSGEGVRIRVMDGSFNARVESDKESR